MESSCGKRVPNDMALMDQTQGDHNTGSISKAMGCPFSILFSDSDSAEKTITRGGPGSSDFLSCSGRRVVLIKGAFTVGHVGEIDTCFMTKAKICLASRLLKDMTEV